MLVHFNSKLLRGVFIIVNIDNFYLPIIILRGRFCKTRFYCGKIDVCLKNRQGDILWFLFLTLRLC